MITQFKLETNALIKISGPDAQSFLQGQLTCDVRDLNATDLRLGAYCNLKGRVIVLFKLFVIDAVYYLQCPKDLAEKAIAKLKQHALFSNVQINDQTVQWAQIGLMGEKEEIEQLFSQYSELFKSIMFLSVSNGSLHPPKGQGRWELIVPMQHIQPIEEALSKACTTQEERYWTLMDIRTGIPEVTAATSEHFLPHYINLPALQAVSFTKGCYHGQEIIARMQYRTTIKKHMVYGIIDKQDNETEAEENKEKEVVVSFKNDNGIVERLVIEPLNT